MQRHLIQFSHNKADMPEEAVAARVVRPQLSGNVSKAGLDWLLLGSSTMLGVHQGIFIGDSDHLAVPLQRA